MFIKSLTIKNFRCFGKGTDKKGTIIELNNSLTAFIGRNGRGKSREYFRRSSRSYLNKFLGQREVY